MTGTEAQHQLIDQIVIAWNSHDFENLVPLYHPDFQGIDTGQGRVYHGYDGLREMYEGYLQSFPDLIFTKDACIVEGEQIALVWSAVGTQRGTILHIPPTGRQVLLKGVTIIHAYAGKIRTASYLWDVAGLLRGLGLLPDL